MAVYTTEFAVLASASRTATENGADISNGGHRGVILFLDVSAVTGTSPTLDVKLQAKDPVSGNYVDIDGGAFAQKIAAGTDSLVVYPGIAETANRSVSDALPRTWRVVSTIGGTTPSFTYSLGACYLP